MTITVTKESALQLMRDVVDEYGEHQTATCLYQLDGNPCCIVGQVLHRAGLSVDQLKVLDDGSPNFVGAADIASLVNDEELMHRLDLSVERDAVMVLRTAQKRQDNAEDWGSALAAAVEHAAQVYP